MPTRKDVAQRAGVSEATVSYALSGKRTISQATRERVFEAMRELDYRPNLMAQALAGGSSSIIALLFPSQERGISNADLEYVLGAASAARELGYHLLLWPTEDRDVSDVASLFQAGLIGGVLLMEVRMKDERLRTLGKAGVPVGLIGRTGAKSDAAIAADRDFQAAMLKATQYLVGLGHTRIGYLSGPQRNIDLKLGAPVRAENGFRSALEATGTTGAVVYCESTIEAGREALGRLSADAPGCTALICLNVEATIGLMQEAIEQGVHIPEDLSIVSIGTPEDFASATTPAITTISSPAEQIGRTAARLLIRSIAGLELPPEQQLWVGELAVRASSGPAPLP
ncbi:MAG: LacI family DNA-binding transcriptional regulator [Actinobacteria bacterium]|nr:LacI family DNA-binding transcriptional regulator [Actinomycetota bacterium]